MKNSSVINTLFLIKNVEDFQPSAKLIDNLAVGQKTRLVSLSKMRQKTFILSRCLLLHALEQQYPNSVGPWKIVERTELPPFVLHPSSTHNVSFSVSHSAKWLGLVICDSGLLSKSCLGLDIETIKATRSTEVATYFCNEQQLSQLAKIKDKLELPRQVTRLWTQKEAYFKAYEEGIFNRQLKSLSIIESNEVQSLGHLKSASLDEESEIAVFSTRESIIETRHLTVNQHGEFVTWPTLMPKWQCNGVKISNN